MEADLTGKPIPGRDATLLGVRTDGPYVDILVGIDGFVEPLSGGLSTTKDNPRALPPNRRPKSLGGKGRHPVFALPEVAVPVSLKATPDGGSHVLIEPETRMLIDAYETALSSTRDDWELIMQD